MRWRAIAVAVVLAAICLAAIDGVRRPAAQVKLRSDAASPAAAASSTPTQRPIPRKPRIAVAFRLDPELTQGMFLGERWVSPPSYLFAQQGMQYVTQARVQYVDDRGERRSLSGDWTTTNPDMVALTPHDTGDVTIVVRRPGESDLMVVTGSGSKRLHVRARQVGDGMQVEFRQ